MQDEYIGIKGARENNLKNVSLRIPKRAITVFTGVSGSGKSSLVFDTIAMEAQRLLSENFSTFIRGFMPKYPQPAADSLERLNMAVVIDQRRMGGGSHSTVGTTTDIYSLLRLLYSRAGVPSLGGANLFSFNDPQGMCPECSGLGRKMGVNIDLFLDESKSLNDGALLFPDYKLGGWDWNLLNETRLFPMDIPLKDFTEEDKDLLLFSKARKVSVLFGGKSMNLTFEGVVEKFTNKYIKQDLKSKSDRTQKAVEPYLTMGPCTLCNGARLSQAALGVRVGGHGIAQLSSMEVDQLLEHIRKLHCPEAEPIRQALAQRLEHLCDIGLEYLSLERQTDSLSGGESARIKMVKHLSSSLVDVLYIFDEPSVGLHPRDVHRLNELLVKLRDKGNTVLVVEHDPDVIKIADHVVDMGPFAGSKGGEVVFQGSHAELLSAPTLTGTHLQQVIPLKQAVRKARGQLHVSHGRANNLKNVSLDFPLGVLTVVSGVAGSGKSSLVHQCLAKQHPHALVIDQSAVGANSRSNPATYTGIMDSIRKAFATANKVQPALFSFNSKGACPECQGLGVVYTDLAYLDEVKLPCEVCGGKRFKDEVLAYTLDGKSIADVLTLTVDQALEFFTLKDVKKVLSALSDVGLGYLSLGQPLSTLSGGECQRIKLGGELHKEASLYILDEPTTGLHPSDIQKLLLILDRLVDAGNTLVVIEHNLDVIRHADWIVDMGPEGGHKGGTILYQGVPGELVHTKESLTARYL